MVQWLNHPVQLLVVQGSNPGEVQVVDFGQVLSLRSCAILKKKISSLRWHTSAGQVHHLIEKNCFDLLRLDSSAKFFPCAGAPF